MKRNEETKRKRSCTCFEYVVSQALYEGVVLISLEGGAVLLHYFIEALDAAVAHSLGQR